MTATSIRLVCFIPLSLCAQALAQRYHLTDLGTLGGNGTFRCMAINQPGQIALSARISSQRVAAIWTPTSPNAMTGTLTAIPLYTDAYEMDAQAINDSGSIAGTAYFNHSLPRAFVWIPASPNGSVGTTTILGTLGGTQSFAYGINNSGQVVGYGDTPSGFDNVFLWNGAMTMPSSIPTRSAGWAINDSGQITGGVSSGPACGGADMAFLGGATSYNPLFYGCYVTTRCYGINASGAVVGQGGNTYGFVWAPGTPNGSSGTLTVLTPPQGASETEAYGINDSGVICGRFYQGYPRACLWTGGTLHELSSLISPPLASGLLWEARSINDFGQIVGTRSNGHVFLATPFCPADFDGDGTIDFFDYDAFVICYEGGPCPPGRTADFDEDATIDLFDYDAFVLAFETGC